MKALSKLFYSISEDKEKSLFKNAYIFFDTSALLDFYYYSESTKSEIFQKLFVALKKRLWIAAQTEYEFLKNREKVFLKPIDTYDNLQKKKKGQNDTGHLEEIEGIIKALTASIKNELTGQIQTFKQKTGKTDKHPYLEGGTFEDFEAKTKLLEAYLVKYHAGFNEFKESIETQISSQKELLKTALVKDTILEEFEKNFQTTPGLSYSDVLKIVEEGEVRYRNLIPPGYLDEDDKIGFQKYGDLILWKQIIAKSKADKKDVILVINDMKEDWWYYSDKTKPVAPRHELIKEIFDEAGRTFWMYNTSDFLFKAKELIALTIKEDVIQDVKHLAKPSRKLGQSAITEWIANYFDSPYFSINFSDSNEIDDYGIDYTYRDAKGEKVGFIHKYIERAHYTGIYLPLREAYEQVDYAKASLSLDKVCLVIECSSYDNGAVLLKHMGRKNPQHFLNLSKGVFRVIILAKEEERLIVVYDSDDYRLV
jgi:hypothetical protein